jgi:hypothetical protein
VETTEHEGDWLGCAKALVGHGMVPARDGQYGDDVVEFFDSVRAGKNRGVIDPE